MGLFSSIKEIFSFNKRENLESLGLFKQDLRKKLYEADLGTALAENIYSKIEKIKDFELAKQNIEAFILDIFKDSGKDLVADKSPYIIMLIGVNGAGKTTMASKLANHFKYNLNKKVLLCGADTFRAGAVEQLKHWAEKISCDFFSKGSGTDPGATAYEAVIKAKKDNYDILIIDTGGRLQNQEGLMAELAKVDKAIGKAHLGAPDQKILVVDGTQGQNVFNQVQDFNKFIELTGIIITKLDSTAKGGAVLRAVQEFKKPILYSSFGEKITDFELFNPKKFLQKFW